MFRLVEAKEILERLRQLEDEYEDLPLIHFLLRDTISVFDTLTGFLAARAILPDREYESLWVDVMLSGSEQNGGRMIANFQANAKEQIREIDTEGIGFEGDTLVVEEGIELTEKETEQGHTLLVDYTTPFGITRCRFLEAGEDRYVCQYPDGSYLPPEMIRMLEERARKSLTAKVLNIRRLPWRSSSTRPCSPRSCKTTRWPRTLRSYHRESRTFRLTWQRQCSNVQIPLPRHWSRSI